MGFRPPRARIAQIADEGTFSEVFRAVSYSDHLAFHDASGAYKDKVEATIAKSGERESVVMGTAKVGGHDVMLGVMDFAFMGGSLGSGTGERIARACEQAIAERRPLRLFSVRHSFTIGFARSNREPRLRGGYAEGLGEGSWKMKRGKLSKRSTTRWES